MGHDDVRVLWEKAAAHLHGVLSPDVYARWIAVIEPRGLDGNTLTLAVGYDFYHTWLEDNYLSLIKAALTTVCGADLDIRFVVDHKVKPPPEEKGPGRPSLRHRLSKRARLLPNLNPRFTFDEFIVGSSNAFAHAAALAVAQAPAHAYNPLFIHGGVGLGKTHLMQGIGHYVATNSRNTICYLSSEMFTNEYIDALQNRSLVQFRKKYRSVGLLLIDDIHFLAGKERLQEEFFHTFNALFDAHRQIVMTSDRAASDIAGLQDRLVSRFEWGLAVELEVPDLETRIAILRQKQSQAPMQMPDPVIQFIARSIRSNIRRLEGALTRTTAYASVLGRQLTLQDAEYILHDTIEQEKEEILTFNRIQRVVADHYDVRVSDMSSKRRPRSIAFPRQVAMYLCRKLTPASLPEIAHAFSKSHGTILHAYRRIEKAMAADPELRQSVAEISQKLGRTYQKDPE